jgi:hypothetical protein
MPILPGFGDMPVRGRRSLFVILCVCAYLKSTVYLLDKHDPRQLVRKGHLGHGKTQISTAFNIFAYAK